MRKLERLFEAKPGYDCIRFECVNGGEACQPGAGGFHGCHGLELRWALRGAKGTIVFTLYSGWLPEPGRSKPVHSDIGYHSPVPMYEGQKPMDGPCSYVDSPCCYDGSSLDVEEPFRVLCNDGLEALWSYLESVYAHRFDGGEYPKPQPYKLALRTGADDR